MRFLGLETRWIEAGMDYSGRELAPHWILRTFRMQGNALVAGIGSCEVRNEHLVDEQDKLEGEFIRARSMVHFLGEFFGLSLFEGVLIQRLFVATISEKLALNGRKVRRQGNDLFIDNRKLSVSIVTATPQSVLLHLGVNVDPEGAPVAAIGLKELEVSAQAFGAELLDEFSNELRSSGLACTKARGMV